MHSGSGPAAWPLTSGKQSVPTWLVLKERASGSGYTLPGSARERLQIRCWTVALRRRPQPYPCSTFFWKAQRNSPRWLYFSSVITQWEERPHYHPFSEGRLNNPHLLFRIFFSFLPKLLACGILIPWLLVPQPGTEPRPLAVKVCQILIIGPQGNSGNPFYLFIWLCWVFVAEPGPSPVVASRS